MSGILNRPRPEQSPEHASFAGGRSAIAGFLFQILRSIELGLRVSVDIVDGSTDHPRMQLKLEPPDGGDHQMDDGNRLVIEQVKMQPLMRGFPVEWDKQKLI